MSTTVGVTPDRAAPSVVASPTGPSHAVLRRSTIEGMGTRKCDVGLQRGGRCNLPAENCESPEHRQLRRLSTARVQDVFANRDIRSVGWYWLEQLTIAFDPKNASPAASFARLIHVLGDAPADEAAAAAEAALFGGIMHGIPPRDAAQWEIVQRVYDPQTVEDLRRWRPNPFTLGPDEDPASLPRPRAVPDDVWSEWDDGSDEEG